MTYNMALPIPSASGSLEGYIQSVQAIPLLSQEEEFELASRFRRDNDLDAARGLVLSHLRLVVSIARGYSGYGLPQADLIQEGNIGLMKAVKRYDPNHGVRLVSFALHWIKAEIHEYIIRNWRLVKIATTKAQRKLFFNLRSMRNGLETLRPHEVSQIASELNVSEQEVIEMETRFNGRDMALEGNNDEEDDSFAPISYLTAGEADEPSHLLEQSEQEQLARTGLAKALASLDERSRHIVESRWLREDDSATLHELAAEYNVSAERIRQIEQKAMEKIRSALLAYRDQ
jgi:RNA polymerase sigma-32 factor